MRLCVVSFKECWTDSTGHWYSSGGFPLQIKALASLFDQTTVMITRIKESDGGIELPENAKVVVLPSPQGEGMERKLNVLTHAPIYLSKMWREIRESQVVYIPLPGDLPLLGMGVAVGLRKHLIVRYGGSWEANDQATLATRFMRWAMRVLAGGRNLMLATGIGDTPPSPNMHWLFTTALTREELETVMPNFERGLSAVPQLVFIGRLSPEKGLPFLFEALKALIEEGFHPVPHLTLIGEGPQRNALETLARIMGLSDYVEFTGQLDRRELSTRLLTMDVAVQPSLTEGLSKAWLDAMAHGLPVIASDVGMARKIIGRDGERGWLVRPGDVSNLKFKLREVLSSPLPWSQVRKRCRQFVEGFTLEAWGDQIARLCTEQWGWAYSNGRLQWMKS